jgi:hypothetical protein
MDEDWKNDFFGQKPRFERSARLEERLSSRKIQLRIECYGDEALF